MSHRSVMVTHKKNRVRFELTAFVNDPRSDAAIRAEAKRDFQRLHPRVPTNYIQSTVLHGSKIIAKWQKAQQ